MDCNELIQTCLRNTLFPGGSFFLPTAIRIAWLRSLERRYPGGFVVAWDTSPHQRTRSRALDYQVTEGLLSEIGPLGVAGFGESQNLITVEEYLDRYRHLIDRHDRDARSEENFLCRCFLPAAGPAALKWLVPQAEVPGAAGNVYQVDYLWTGGDMIAFEIEGASYHAAGTQRHAEDTLRQSELAAAGIRIERIAYQNIVKRPDAVQKQIRRALGITTPFAENPNDSRPIHFFQKSLTFTAARLTGLFLDWLEHPELPASPQMSVLDLTQSYGLPAMLLHQIQMALEHLCAFWQVRCDRSLTPTFSVARLGQDREFTALLWQEYSLLAEDLPDCGFTPVGKPGLVDLDPASAGESPGRFDVILSCDTAVAFHSLDQYRAFMARCDDWLTDQGFLEVLEGWGSRVAQGSNPGFCRTETIVYPSLAPPRSVKFFLYWFFGFSKLRDGQYQLLERALTGKNLLGILPTGAGKSLVFQLAALLLPGMTIVISPLKSLMFDQVENLKRNFGLHVAERIASGQEMAEKQFAMQRAVQGKIKLLYVAPERLLIESFTKDVLGVTRGRIAYLAIDEAHCVSEWGHDFRPAYLTIRRLLRSLEQQIGRRIPLVALTATASFHVREDIIRLLGLNKEDLPEFPTMNRPELSFQVVQSNSTPQRLKNLESIIRSDIPKILAPGEADPTVRTPSGIIFTLYAAAKGKNSRDLSALQVANRLNEAKLSCRHYFSADPDPSDPACPRCGAQTWMEEGLSYEYKCPNCGREFGGRNWQQPIKDHGWRCPACQAKYQKEIRDTIKGKPSTLECSRCGTRVQKDALAPNFRTKQAHEREKLETHLAFKKGHVHRIVATKGFGMGIDKPDIRYIIHLMPPTSLEGYYQEAGRAGRDGRHAHCVLFINPPVTECKESAQPDQLPRCMFGENLQYWKCPHNPNGRVCDYYDALHFLISPIRRFLLAQSQPRVGLDWLQQEFRRQEEEYFKCLLDGILSSRQPSCRFDFLAPPDQPGEYKQVDNRTEYTLLKGLELGILERYFKDYQNKLFMLDYPGQPPSREHVLDQTVQYLVSLREPAERKSAEASLLQNLRRATADSPMNECISNCVGWMAEDYFKFVIRSRLRMPYNLKDFALADDCRKRRITSYFDSESIGNQAVSFNCGMCDRCVPDLHFLPPEEAPQPEAAERRDVDSDKEAQRFSEIRSKRDSLLDSYSVASTAAFVSSLTKPEIDFIRTSAGRRLESSPTAAAFLMLYFITADESDGPAQRYLELTLEYLPDQTPRAEKLATVELLAKRNAAQAYRQLNRWLESDPSWRDLDRFNQMFSRWAPEVYRHKLKLLRSLQILREVGKWTIKP